jgi:hypothetical protein
MKKQNITLALVSGFLFFSCYSHKKVLKEGLPYSKSISWPIGYNPSESDFFVPNEIHIKASPQVVWDVLIQAEKWQDFYKKAKGLDVQNATDGKLFLSAIFTWYPAGKFTSTIQKFEAPSEIAWSADDGKEGMAVYHAWKIIPTENGCKLITQESQNGPRTFWEKIFVPKMVKKHHQMWLEGIKTLAEKN